jgi:hypothetical protein
MTQQNIVNKDKVTSEFAVSGDSIPRWRVIVGMIREKSGYEKEGLYLADILRKSATELGLHDDAFHLILEQSLIWQHIAMEERDKPEDQKNAEREKEAIQMMDSTANEAEKYHQTYGLEHLRGDSLRFLGKVAEYKGEHKDALNLYRESKRSFLGFPEGDRRRVRWIEVQGFEASSLIMNGEVENGIQLAKETWNSYNNIDLDPYTSKVWQSGVAIGVVRALLATNNVQSFGIDQARKWLSDAEGLLVLPEDLESWGDKNFTIRKKEIKKLKSELDKIST